LATLPWIEARSIRPNVATQQVTFGFRDKEAFSLDEVKNAIETKTPFRLGRVIQQPQRGDQQP
jgi:hypothetical protein